MVTNLSASRVVDGDPADVLLLISGPEAAHFLPQTTLDVSLPGRMAGTIELPDGSSRGLSVTSAPPRRTPVAYLSEFQLTVEGMPPARGALQVTSAGPAQSTVLFSLQAADEIPADLAEAFGAVAQSFFDGLERAARSHVA